MGERLKGSFINLFSVGEVGFFTMMLMAVNYYAYFLTDVAHISAAVTGTILLFARIADAVSVPVVGIIVERSYPKWGKYRSWVLIAPFFSASFFILMFTNPGLSMVGKAVFLGVVYICGHITVNFASTGYYALSPLVATDPRDRVTLSSRRAQSVSFAQLIFGLIAMPLVIFLGSGDEGRGFFLTIIIFSVLQVLGYQLVARVTKPYDSGQQIAAKATVSLKDMIVQILGNSKLLVLILADTFRYTLVFVVNGFAIYYFKYVSGNMLLISVYFTTISAASFIGAAIGQQVAQRISKKVTYVLAMAIGCLSMFAAQFFAGSVWSYIILVAVACGSASMANVLTVALYSDVSEYVEWKTGKSVRGLIMGMLALPLKAGVALSGMLIGFSLAAIGYIADMAPTAELTKAITTIATMVPATFGFLAIVTILFYNLNNKRLAEIRIDMAERSKTF